MKNIRVLADDDAVCRLIFVLLVAIAQTITTTKWIEYTESMYFYKRAWIWLRETTSHTNNARIILYFYYFIKEMKWNRNERGT